MNAAAPPSPTIRTTCPYCGVGCGVLAQADGRGGAAIAGDPTHPANLGRLCSKGSALGLVAHDALEQHRMTPGGVRAGEHDEVGELEIRIGPRHRIGPEGAAPASW